MRYQKGKKKKKADKSFQTKYTTKDDRKTKVALGMMLLYTEHNEQEYQTTTWLSVKC